MARLDRWRPLAREFFKELSHHPVTRMAAALAYFALLSLPGLLAVVVGVVGTVVGAGQARAQVVGQAWAYLGREVAAALETILDNVPVSADVASVPQLMALGGLVLGATAGFVELQDVLNTLWHARHRRSSLASLLLKRLLGFLMVVGVAVLLTASVIVTTVLSMGAEMLETYGLGTWSAPLVWLLEIAVSLGVVALALAGVYKFLPDRPVPLRPVLLGAGLAAVLLMAAKYGLALYVAHANLETAYGKAGSLVVLLFSLYVSALVVLLGAIFTRAHARCLARPPVAC